MQPQIGVLAETAPHYSAAARIGTRAEGAARCDGGAACFLFSRDPQTLRQTLACRVLKMPYPPPIPLPVPSALAPLPPDALCYGLDSLGLMSPEEEQSNQQLYHCVSACPPRNLGTPNNPGPSLAFDALALSAYLPVILLLSMTSLPMTTQEVSGLRPMWAARGGGPVVPL